MTWGPDGKHAAIAVTFDNFGEAAELEYNLWSDSDPVGDHVTAKQVLPCLLEDLEAAQISATFFVEGWNGKIYPDQISRMWEMGHEVAIHGWRHEVWSEQDHARRDEILKESLEALSGRTGRPVGFRPPGGDMTEDTPTQLAQWGLKYVSPEGDSIRNDGHLVTLPFRWSEVDALYFEPLMGLARKDKFGSSALRPVDDWRDALNNVTTQAVTNGGCYAIIFHPYLLSQDPKRYDTFRDYIHKLKALSNVWIAPCAEIAEWIAEHQEKISS